MANFFNAEAAIIERLKHELSPKLTYHSYFHTLDVLNAAMIIASTENISKEELSLLRVAVAYHDSGFIEAYKDHELKSCEYARKELPDHGFTADQIELICGIIMATKIPQNPTTLLQQIIADADLDYLGRPEYQHIAAKLYDELTKQSLIQDEKKWMALQESFIKSHKYFTKFSKTNREQVKLQHLQKIIDQGSSAS